MRTQPVTVTDVTDDAVYNAARRAAGLGLTAYDRAGLDANGRDENGTDWSDWIVPGQ